MDKEDETQRDKEMQTHPASLRLFDSNHSGKIAAQAELSPSCTGRHCFSGNDFTRTELVPLKIARKVVKPAIEYPVYLQREQ
jgi:hypothetical protein